MACEMDATILLEQPPTVEFIDGLFYFTDKVGDLTIRRCLRPSAFLKSVRNCQRLADEFTRAQRTIQMRA